MNAATSVHRPPLAGDVTALIIGAGQAGLATSYYLDQHGIDHAILERGEVANTWRTERWDSLRLLSPNHQTRLPSFEYQGNDPDGYMGMAELIEFFSRYASGLNAPLHCHTTVEEVLPCANGYRVVTNRGEWRCRSLVLASGAYNLPLVPALDKVLPDSVTRLTAHQYRNPGQLDSAGVMVVGASATGLQIADEIRRSGREVTLSVGEHLRLPRRYRGRDILRWMVETGLYGQCIDEVDDINRVRSTPSPQLVGSDDFADLDLNTAHRSGITIAGRLMSAANGKLQFSGGLNNLCKLADLKMQRLLAGIDAWVEATGCDTPPPESFEPTVLENSPLDLDLQGGDIKTIIWACGFKPDYSWLSVPVLDRKGRLAHDGGVTAAAGLYAMGLPFMRRRSSAFIYGVQEDAREICAHLSDYICGHARSRYVAVA